MGAISDNFTLRTDGDIQNRKKISTAIRPAFGEESPVNFGLLTTKLWM